MGDSLGDSGSVYHEVGASLRRDRAAPRHLRWPRGRRFSGYAGVGLHAPGAGRERARRSARACPRQRAASHLDQHRGHPGVAEALQSAP